MHQSFQDFLDEQAKKSLPYQLGVVIVLELIATVIDFSTLLATGTREWPAIILGRIFALSLVFIYIGALNKRIYKWLRPSNVVLLEAWLASGIAILQNLIALSHYQAVYVSLMLGACAFFLSSHKHFYAVAVPLISSYVLSRFYLHPAASFGEEWYAFDVQVLFMLALSTAIIRYRLENLRTVFHHLKTIELQRMHGLYSSKMNALGEMANAIAHEVNNPLAIVSLSAQHIQMWSDDESEQRVKQTQKSATKIIDTVERIALIISALRTFSAKAEIEEYTTVSVSEIAEKAYKLLRSRLDTLKITYRYTEDTNVRFQSNQAALLQVFVNMLTNSMEALEALGNQDEKWIRINVETNSDLIRIRIADSGPRVSDSIADKMMEPFFTTKEFGKAMGLGLSVSKGYIKMHRGDLYLDTESENTCFVIELPRDLGATISELKPLASEQELKNKAS